MTFPVIWYAIGLLLLPFCSSLLMFQVLPWQIPHPRLLGILTLAYLIGALVLLLTRACRRSPPFAVLLTSAVLSTAYLVLLLLRWTYSRRVLVVGSALLAALLLLPQLHEFGRRWRRFLTAGGLVLAAAAIVMPAMLEREESGGSSDTGSVSSRYLTSSHLLVRATYHSGFLPPAPLPHVTGGALAVLGDGYLLVRGRGDLYRVHWDQDDSLQLTRLAWDVPINNQRFEAETPSGYWKKYFRVADLLVIPDGDSLRVLATHHHWNSMERCFVVRLSAIMVSRRRLEAQRAGWTTLYETRPCLPLKQDPRGMSFAGLQVGGRLAPYAADEVLVTVGDHEFDGLNGSMIVSQDPGTDYGKTIIVNTATGASRLFTLGHRNPQGLFIDAESNIWSTEHGPQGGDELNTLVEGANYGWPFRTYGTAYDAIRWPLSQPGDSGFREPVYAWVPSIGVSNLIRVDGSQFAEWRGDLLIASLGSLTLFRTRLRNQHVVYVEPLFVDRRIRDLVEGPSGEIVLWTDDDELVRLQLARSAEDGAAVFLERCTGCHRRLYEAMGPPLAGVYGRRIASAEGFPYSEALQSLDGIWTKDRLRAFLNDPASFAPGTSMAVEGIADSTQLTHLLEYLELWSRTGGEPDRH